MYRWFKEQIGVHEALEAEQAGRSFYDAMNERIEAVPVGSRGLLVLPYFAAAATPRYNPEARGMVLGLTFSHTGSTSHGRSWRASPST